MTYGQWRRMCSQSYSSKASGCLRANTCILPIRTELLLTLASCPSAPSAANPDTRSSCSCASTSPSAPASASRTDADSSSGSRSKFSITKPAKVCDRISVVSSMLDLGLLRLASSTSLSVIRPFSATIALIRTYYSARARNSRAFARGSEVPVDAARQPMKADRVESFSMSSIGANPTRIF